MERKICILRCITEKKSDKQFLFILCMPDGNRYTMRTKNNKLYQTICKAQNSGNEELIYNTWIEAARKILDNNDVYFDTIEIL